MHPASAPEPEGTVALSGDAIRDMVEFIARGLVDNQEAVVVTHHERGHAVEVRLKVDPDEMGKVIGRQGRVAKALRAVLAAAATRAGKRAILEIG